MPLRILLSSAADGVAIDRSHIEGQLRGKRKAEPSTQLVPGTVHHITIRDLPPPDTSDATDNGPTTIPRPARAWPKAPPGFKVELSSPRGSRILARLYACLAAHDSSTGEKSPTRPKASLPLAIRRYAKGAARVFSSVKLCVVVTW